MNKFFLLLFLSMSLPLTAQKANENNIFKDNIHTVRFHLKGTFLSYPILDIKSNAQLVLSFDDFNEDVMDYIYTVTLCNADWTEADLDEMEYIDGFNGERVDEYDFSFNTFQDYTHYQVAIPNENIDWRLSGNYLLRIYEDTEERDLVLTRRFMVVEPLVRVIPEIVRPSTVSKMKTHHEIDFLVNYKGLNINSPQVEIKSSVLQNGRWDNAKTNLKPVYVKGEDILFDYQDKIVFPAGKEFRYLDIRTFRYHTEKVAEITRTNDQYDVMLFKEKSRAFQKFSYYKDINGNYIVEHLERENADLQGDYASVFFALEVSQELYETDVYVFGYLTDWQLKEEFKLKYNPMVGAYVGRAMLKQGYYDYYYVDVPAGSKTPGLEEFEGNNQETENDYTILVYWKPFGARHDRLVAAYTINSTAP